jgi:hypothetical protein
MRRNPLDEVLIVNPSPPGFDPNQGDRIMLGYHAGPGFGYVADGYGGFAADPYWAGGWAGPFGSWADEDPSMLGWAVGEAPGLYRDEGSELDGWADAGYGPYGWYADGYDLPDEEELGDWEGYEDYDDWDDPDALEDGCGYGGCGYGACGYADEETYGWYADDEGAPGDMGDEELYAEGEFDVAGYVREEDRPFNPRVIVTSGVSGYDQVDPGLEGYVRPGTVNAICTQFTPQPGAPPDLPDTLRPLW